MDCSHDGLLQKWDVSDFVLAYVFVNVCYYPAVPFAEGFVDHDAITHLPPHLDNSFTEGLLEIRVLLVSLAPSPLDVDEPRKAESHTDGQLVDLFVAVVQELAEHVFCISFGLVLFELHVKHHKTFQSALISCLAICSGPLDELAIISLDTLTADELRHFPLHRGFSREPVYLPKLHDLP